MSELLDERPPGEGPTGDWPDIRDLVRREVDAYLAYVTTVEPGLPTRCPPWTVRDVTRHLAATFARFVAMHQRGRRGDLTPPFAPEDLDAENLRAVRHFSGDPETALRWEADRFLDMAEDPDAVMPHQRGPVPVGMNLVFALADVAIHHDDVAVAAGSSYVPPDDVVATLVESFRRLGQFTENDAPQWSSFVSERGS